jgi:hypothetical protein
VEAVRRIPHNGSGRRSRRAHRCRTGCDHQRCRGRLQGFPRLHRQGVSSRRSQVTRREPAPERKSVLRAARSRVHDAG